jgi:hypothetical protein
MRICILWDAHRSIDAEVIWYMNYCCRDDYGATTNNTSAWAGIQYFASRESEEKGPLTWPEGNGWIVRRLLERVGSFVETNRMVHKISRRKKGFSVLAGDTEYQAEFIIFAAPTFLIWETMSRTPPEDGAGGVGLGLALTRRRGKQHRWRSRRSARRLINLIFAGRNRMLIIRRELPRTRIAGLVMGTYCIESMRVLLFVEPSIATSTACLPANGVRLMAWLWFQAAAARGLCWFSVMTPMAQMKPNSSRPMAVTI